MTNSIANIETSDRQILGQVLQLIPALGDLAPFDVLLQATTREALQLRQTYEEWLEAGVWNDGHVLASVLRCINQISHTTIGESLRHLVQDLDGLVGIWSWNREVMEQLADVAPPGL